jgi:ribosomal protein L24
MQKKLHIRKGDTVIVISGESKGQKGRVLEIDRKKDRAIVEGVNTVSKHRRKLRYTYQTFCLLILLRVSPHVSEGSLMTKIN